MLAVVDHQQDSPGPQVLQEHIDGPPRGLQLESQCCQNRSGNGVGIGERGQLDQPHPVGSISSEQPRDLDREARLAYASGADQRYQRRLFQQLAQLLQLAVPTDEGSPRPGQIPRNDCRHGQGREALPQIRVQQLEDPLCPRKVLQGVQPEVMQFEHGRQRPGE